MQAINIAESAVNFEQNIFQLVGQQLKLSDFDVLSGSEKIGRI